MPHTTPLGLVYDSGDFARNLTDALAAADAAGFAARRAEARRRGRYRGLGHAVYIEQSGFPPDEFAELRFDPSGTLTLLMGTQSSGQGHQTAYAQLAVEKLGLPLDRIRVLQGDTAAIGFGRGTGGSRSLPVGGAALVHAADKLIDKGRRIAAHMLEAAEADIAFEDGVFAIPGTDRSVTLDAVARAAFNPGQLPEGVEPGFAESGHFTPPALVNAVIDAVSELGIDHLDMPLTPERLWRALRRQDLPTAA
jgi:carbon-monoxide dehydrogenase large subunit